jgi:formylglycine-generating enzyme required for sulfatase activity
MLLDACHSGGAKAPNLEEDDDPPDAPKPEKKPRESVTLGQLNKEAQDKLKEVSSSQKPLAILTSCSQDEVSREGKGNGLFTQFMLAGLSGKADKNGDGVVSTKELAFYLNAVIPEETDSAQRPDYNFSRTWSGEKGLPLAVGTESKATRPEVAQPETRPEVTQPETKPEVTQPNKKTEAIKPMSPIASNRPWYISMALELGVPERVLQPLRKNFVTGQTILDMTSPEWQKLNATERTRYAKAYQKAYAIQLGVPVEAPYEIEGVSFTMLLIPPGRFLMGSPEGEEGRHNLYEKQRVVIISKPFWIAKYEVSQAQWKAVMGKDPSSFPSDSGDLPVHAVSWNSADSFTYLSETKLPTEAQWEYACRAGTNSAFNLGKVLKPKLVSFNRDEYKETPVVVGSLDNANNWGVYDFHGNVSEWCQDVYDEYPAKKEIVDPLAAADPQTDNPYRVLRGGYWSSQEKECRSAKRYSSGSNHSQKYFGLRIVRDVLSDSPFVLERTPPPAKASNDWVSMVAVEAGTSSRLLETMIYLRVGKKLLNMADDDWLKLHYSEQIKLAAAYQKAYAKTLGLEVEKAFDAGDTKILMRLIPPGRYRMGSPLDEAHRRDDEICHAVTLTKPFWVSKYEVTEGQWQAVMGGKTPAEGQGDMVKKYVVWQDCRKFCDKIEMRLLTEAEWEYACRAGTTTPFNLGIKLDAEVTNYNGESPYRSDKEGKRRNALLAVGVLNNANAWGCCDFHGNLREWCEDAYQAYSAKEVTDPPPYAKESVHCIVRGGGFMGLAHECRSARRDSRPTESRSGDTQLGFRVAVTVEVK